MRGSPFVSDFFAVGAGFEDGSALGAALGFASGLSLGFDAGGADGALVAAAASALLRLRGMLLE